jgi:hypothetical protein
MRINQLTGFKTPDRIAVSIKNADTVSIPAGSPVVLAMNGTDDGVAVVLPTTSGAANLVQGLRYGVNTRTLAVGQFGDAVVFGLTNNLLLMRQTRASSSNVWASEPARSIGEFLGVSSAINGYVTEASTIGLVGLSASTATAATTPLNTITIFPDAVLGQTLPTYASSASATSDTRTAITAAVKAFVRMM